MKKKTRPLGVHTSIAGGVSNAVDRAASLGCTAFQIFGRNPRGWPKGAAGNDSPIDLIEASAFREKREAAGIGPAVIHTSYLINLASPDEALQKKSLKLFEMEIAIADSIGAEYLVMHPGSTKGTPAADGIKRVAAALTAAGRKKPQVEVLLENTAGSGSHLGGDLREIRAILTMVKGLKVGLCFDTCHGFAAGYPLNTAAGAKRLPGIIDKEVGLTRLKVIHLNDSKGAFGSRVDRHEDIGKGNIGGAALGAFLKHKDIREIPLILETPTKDDTDDLRNLRATRRLLT